jgi:hypothetical protein
MAKAQVEDSVLSEVRNCPNAWLRDQTTEAKAHDCDGQRMLQKMQNYTVC